MLPSTSITLYLLKDYLLSAIDVGASNGIQDHWKPYLSAMRVHAVEPNAENCSKMSTASHPNISWHPIGLANTSGEHNLYVLNAPTGSSLYPPSPIASQYTPESYMGVRKIAKIPCLSFADFLSKNQVSTPHLVKLDTQGSELSILESLLSEHWESLLCIQTEVEFRPLYQNQPLFEDVHAYMTAKGFRLVDLHTARSYRMGRGQSNYYLKNKFRMAFGTPKISAELLAGEALYLKEFEDLTIFRTKSDFARFMLILYIYHYFDTAYWLIDQMRECNLFSSEELDRYEQEIMQVVPRPSLKEKESKNGRRFRRLLGNPRPNLYQAFWTMQRWPDQ